MNGSDGFRWWHAVLIFVLANVASALPAGFAGDFAFYNALRQPAIAPPGWAFAPVWLVLNVTSLIALWRIAHSPARSAGRTLFLWSEGVGWLLFAAFTTLFFLLRSPVLGAADTLAGLIAAAVSLACASRLDRLSAGLILLRVLWLLLAGTVAIHVALFNADTFLGTGPLLG
jgi:tryptophan-rich sensory protein